jgi:putative ABC transport system substrate-binding protein
VRRREFIATFVVVLALARRARAAGAPVRRIGLLRLGPPPESNWAAFTDGLRALGYRLGENLVIEERLAERAADLPALARDLVQYPVDVIFASSTLAAMAAQQATRTIPIVFVAVTDPIQAGLVASLVRPGGNATGLGFVATDLTGKRLQLLLELVPFSCIAVLANTDYPTNAPQIAGVTAAAQLGNIKVELLAVADPEGFAGAFATAKACGALLVLDAPLFTNHRRRLAELAAENAVPTIYGFREYAEAGGLMSYGVDLNEHYRRAAVYVDKILKGANPAELPVELPDKLELVINLKTTKALGLTVPPALLARADQVIE